MVAFVTLHYVEGILENETQHVEQGNGVQKSTILYDVFYKRSQNRFFRKSQKNNFLKIAAIMALIVLRFRKWFLRALLQNSRFATICSYSITYNRIYETIR